MNYYSGIRPFLRKCSGTLYLYLAFLSSVQIFNTAFITHYNVAVNVYKDMLSVDNYIVPLVPSLYLDQLKKKKLSAFSYIVM